MTEERASLPAPSRRAFLRWTGALSVAAAVGWHVWGRRPLPDGRPGAAFSPAQLRTLERACAVSLADEEAGRVAAADLDAFFAGTGRPQAPDLALALTLLELAPGGLLSARRFSRLDLPDAAAVLAAWERSALAPRRQIAKALRDAARFTWFAREETWGAFAYDGPWVGR